MKKIIFILLFISSNAFAFKPYVGTSLFYSNINDPKYIALNEFESITNPNLNSIYVGILHSKNNVVFSIQTNRLFNRSDDISVVDANNTVFRNKVKITNDTALLGFRFNRLTPSLLITNTRVDKALFYKGGFVASSSKHSILYGVNLSYFLTKNIVPSFTYIAPNKEQYLESSFGLSINYLF